MLKHYFKTTFRYLTENKIFSAINLFGLSLALCIVYFTFYYVRFEQNYDQFNKNVDRIYRISTDIKSATGINKETSPAPLAEALEREFPEVEKAARTLLDYYIISKNQENFGEETVAYVDSSIFSIFTFPMLRGNASAAFDAPFNLVLSETAAKKYFGTTDCLNQTLQLDGKIDVTVTGVMKDMPHNSHFRADLLLSISSLLSSSDSPTVQWQRFGFSTYALLKENSDIATFQQKLDAFARTIPINNQLQYALVSEPLHDLYLQGSIRGNKAGATSSGNSTHIYIFSFVAFFVLCIACFNYINLTTALSLKRAKEVGVRQVLGASKKQLVTQFFMDALLLSLLAFLISIGLCALAAPCFNILVGKVVVGSIHDFTAHLPHALAIALLTGLFSGCYPAFFLSGFKPVNTLKGKFANSHGGLALRRSLVVAQFVVFTLLAVTTIVVYRQLHFMRNENLGFNKAHNLVIDFHYDKRIGDHAENVKTESTRQAFRHMYLVGQTGSLLPSSKTKITSNRNFIRTSISSMSYFWSSTALE